MLDYAIRSYVMMDGMIWELLQRLGFRMRYQRVPSAGLGSGTEAGQGLENKDVVVDGSGGNP